MPSDANLRQHAPSRGARVVPLFLSSQTARACPECGKLIQTRKPAVVCSARCRAAASRRRRIEDALLKLDVAEKGLLAALEVVQQLRAVLVFRGAP
jgi:predicted nucleic acid-binding Zn ribbon protein